MHSAYPRILLALDQGRRRLARALVTSGVIRVIGATLAALAGAVLWAALQKVLRIHSVPVAVLVSLGALACFGFAVVRWLVLPLWRLPRRDAFVNLVERRYPGERNLIVNAYQLGEARPGTQGAEAPELVDTLVARAADRVGALDLTKWRDPRPDRPYLWAGAAGIAAVALLGLLSPTLLVGASRQVVSPGLAQAPPVTLRVTPGDLEVERGSDVPVTVAVAGTGKRPTLRYRERSGSWRTRELVPTAPEAVSRDGGAWQALLPDVDRDLEYVLRVSGSESPLYAILVREPLRLSGFQIHLRFPAYAGLPPETITAGTGDIAALKGTDVDLRLLANRSLSGATLEWRREGSETVESIPLTPAGVPEGQVQNPPPADIATWRGRFTLRDPARYTVLLTGASGETWRSPSYRVEPAQDRAPLLTLHFPPDDHDLSEDMGERVVADAADDFGFSACRLVYRVDDGEERVMRYSPFTGGQKEFRLDTLWDLSGLSLAPGSLVSYYLEVLDNDTVSGPKAARSPIRRVRFPTVSEIYEDVAQDHDREIDNLAHLQDTQEDLHEHLEKLEDELKRGRELNYDLRQDVERSLDQQRELERQLQELVGRLQETVSKASNRAQMNNDLVQKMSEINELLENLQGQEMKRALDQLAQSLSRMDRNAMRQALEEFQTTQEDMLRGLDRTIELLKQVRREEQVEDVVRRTDEIAELQREIAEEMRKLNEEMGGEKAPDAPGEEASTPGLEDPELPEDAMQDPAQDREGAPNEEGSEKPEAGEKGEPSDPGDSEKGEAQEKSEASEKDASDKDASDKEAETGKNEKGEPKGEKGAQESKEGESQKQSGDSEAGEEGEQGKQGDQEPTPEEKALAKDLKELAESLKKARERLAQEKDSAGTSSSSPQQKQSGNQQQQQQRMKQLGQDQKRAQELVEELQRTLETLKKLNQKEQEQLSEELEQMEQSESMKQLKKSMEESLSGMQSQAPQRASKYAFEARDQAMNLAGIARNMQAQMQTKQDDEIIQMVERLIEGLIELSGGEESLVESPEPDDRVLARQQFHLGGTAEALAESLEAIAKKSLQISEDQRKHLSGAAARMDRATRLYEQGNRSKGVHEGRESASDVNEMIVGLMQSHAQMCQSQGQGTSSESMKQKMQGLSQAQQDLNRSTREMMERMAGRGRLSMTEAQRLGQLAAQQEMIRQGLEQAMNDHQEMKELLGDLDHVEKEMEAVEQNLRQSEADPRILDRQEKILSRLLDAQRSMRQQEMSPERESHTGTLVERRAPAPLPEHLLRSERTLEEDVLRGADDRYPSQYRKLVEAYFRALAREDRNR